MNVNKGILIHIKPNKGQRDLLNKHFGHNRFLWNYFLNKRRTEYQASKTGSTYIKDAATLTKLRHDDKYNWLSEASAASQQRTLKHLDDAYKRFFKGHTKFPNFKSKKHEQSFTLSGSIRVVGKRIIFPKFQDGLKFNRALPGFVKINNITIRRVASGKYYAALSVEAEVKALPKTGKETGIDLGLKDFAVFSEGEKIKSPKFFRKQQVALRRAQKHLARKRKGGKRRECQRKKVAKIHERITNARKDFLHKTSAYVVRKFDTVCVENLAVKNMVKNRSLAKSISDSGWSRFLSMLTYKTNWYGKNLVKIGRFYPSSKTCGACGFIHQSLQLDERKWTCLQCEEVHDRDVNAARNILNEGKRTFGAAIPEHRRRGSGRPVLTRSRKAAPIEASNPKGHYASKG